MGSQASRNYAYSKSQGDATNGYTYSQISQTIKQKLSDFRKRITKIYMYQSPVKDSFFSKVSDEFKHLEIIIQIESILNMVISFGKDGLQIMMSTNLDDLISRREQNNLKKQKDVSVSVIKAKEYILKKQSKPYSLRSWNCRHFATQLWNTLA